MAQLMFTALPLAAIDNPLDQSTSHTPPSESLTPTTDDPLEGLTPEQRSDYGHTSSYLGVPMLTAELILRHSACLEADRASKKAQSQDAPDARKLQREQEAQVRAERNAVVEHARTEWKQAVAQRKEAMAGWDAYVKVKHDAFVLVRSTTDA